MTTQTDVRHAVVPDSSRTRRSLAQAREAVRAFLDDRSAPIQVEPGHGAAREARNELERREAIRDREIQAAQARLREREGGTDVAADLLGEQRPRAVIVHRMAWIRDSLCQQLVRAGVDVVALHEDGAAGLGCVVAEQPDLLVVQQQLPWRSGADVLADTRRFSPGTRIAVHLDQAGAEASLREAGAHLTFSRSTQPAEMAVRLVQPDPTAALAAG